MRERKFTFLDLAPYRHYRENLPKEYWVSVLTSREVALVNKHGFSLDVYNPQLCACQFGVMKSCAIPLGKVFARGLSEQAIVLLDDFLAVIASMPEVALSGPLPYHIGDTFSYLDSWYAT